MKKKVLSKDDFYYASFLKRKRIEQHKTQEEVAEGICTVSYLSRIENSVVAVDENYYVYLFKKLNIDFMLLKETKDYRLFQDLLKYYLLGDSTKALELINEGMSTNFYLETEYDLMLFDSLIIENRFFEAKTLISKMEEKIDIMLEEELLFYLILKVRLYYKMNEGKKAFEQVLLLCEGLSVMPIYKYAVVDIALDIFIYVGSHEIFFKYFQVIDDEDFKTYYSRSFIKHKAQKIFLEYSIRKDETYHKLCDIKISGELIGTEEIDWLILKNLYRTTDPKVIFKVLNNLNYNSKVIAFEGILILRLKDESYFKHFLEMLKDHKFITSEYYLELICKVVIMLKQNIAPIETLDKLKELISLLKDKVCEKFFLDIFKIIYLELALKIGKYKEAALRSLDIEKHKLDIPYFI